MSDAVNHPKHYCEHPSGVECIEVVEHMNFCVGNAIKYLWRAGLKGDAIEDLRKARWYVDREIARIEESDENEVFCCGDRVIDIRSGESGYVGSVDGGEAHVAFPMESRSVPLKHLVKD
jgi:hypothetical protein